MLFSVKMRHWQQTIIEAADAGERAGGWFLQHFRICSCLHYDQPKGTWPWCQEVQRARAFLLAEGAPTHHLVSVGGSAGNTQELPKISMQQIPSTCFHVDIWRFVGIQKVSFQNQPFFGGIYSLLWGPLLQDPKLFLAKWRSWDTILYTFWSPPWALLCSLRQIV